MFNKPELRPRRGLSVHLPGRAAAVVAVLFVIAAAVSGAEKRQYKLRVDGIACPFCAYGIKKRLREIDGLKEPIEADIKSGTLTVTMAQGKTLSEERARKAVKEAGFTLRGFEEAGVDNGRRSGSKD